MRVQFFSSGAVAFNDYNECANIEGYMFRLLLQEFFARKKKSSKSDRVIIREIVAAWPREVLDWVSIQEANK